MDNLTIIAAFRNLKEGQKIVLSCENRTYTLRYGEQIILKKGNDIQIGDYFYIDCTYVQCMSVKPVEDEL